MFNYNNLLSDSGHDRQRDEVEMAREAVFPLPNFLISNLPFEIPSHVREEGILPYV